jgi:DNA-binding IclR family transcriptional regulator
MTTVSTLDKSLSILEEVVRSPEGIGTRALARQFDLNVATVHHIAMTFVRRYYLRQDETTRKFRAGIKLHTLGRAPSARLPLEEVAAQMVERLCAELNESVMVCLLEGNHLVNLAFAAGKQALRVHEPEDMSAYAHCTAAGKVLLAHLPAPRLETFLAQRQPAKLTARTLTTAEELAPELAAIRTHGHGHTEDEFTEGVSAYAVPIHGAFGEVFASIGASAPTVRMKSPETIAATLAGLRAAAAELEAFLKK